MNQISKHIDWSGTDILRQVFDKSPEGFQVIDKNWRYLYVNEAVAKQGMNTVTGLTGNTMMEMYPGIEKQPFFEYLKRCMDEKVGVSIENQFVYPNGQKGWFQLFIRPWIGGIMIFSIDISYRKMIEQRILDMIETSKGAASTEGDRKNLDDLKRLLENLSTPKY
jgi:PAS domain S-box-containing protein